MLASLRLPLYVGKSEQIGSFLPLLFVARMTCHAAHAVVGARKQLELHAAISAGVGAGLILIVVASGCTGHSQQFPQEEPQHSGRSPVLGMYGSAVRAMAASCSILAADSGEQFCFFLIFFVLFFI